MHAGASRDVVLYPPTEEFPGGVALQPARHASVQTPGPSMAPSFFAKGFFADPTEASDGMGQSDGELISDSDSLKPFVEHVSHASAGRPQQVVVGCGAPPCGRRPNFGLLACLLGMLRFGIAGVAAGFGDIDNNPVTEDPVVCIVSIGVSLSRVNPT
ncbi:hypothetical protein CYMTET_30161 [Cymbomonas tetramitiformis]|uniref:Uncharacterized protein n=1 Tax=Cymbomonas tetramitiformis TaxID=36881 RepID=A0AAE0FJE0_9CHLO|nr:hypothetical protein CYMTET_30161 [Cymbomonas tetramitiformis]